MKNNEITIKAEKNGLLPTVDAYAFYGASALAAAQNPAKLLNFVRRADGVPAGNRSRRGLRNGGWATCSTARRRTRAWA
jgi:hypothetical protein